jgi:hypothetical protein
LFGYRLEELPSVIQGFRKEKKKRKVEKRKVEKRKVEKRGIVWERLRMDTTVI